MRPRDSEILGHIAAMEMIGEDHWNARHAEEAEHGRSPLIVAFMVGRFFVDLARKLKGKP